MIYNTFVLVQDIPSFGHPSQVGHGEGEDFEKKKKKKDQQEREGAGEKELETVRV